MRTARILAVAVSAALGVAGGVASGLLMDQDERSDPLSLGMAQVDQSCTGQYLLVTATGTTEVTLGPGIPEDPDTGRYLSIARSCPTAWRPHGTRTDGYATYLGPFDTARDACTERVQHRGAFVTKLRRGDQEAIQCLCFLPEESMPELSPGEVVGVADGVYARMLEDVLTSMALLPTTYHYSGRFDPPFVGAVELFQRDVAIPATGAVDRDTWHSLKNQGCQDLGE